jgi:hypothetical protein
VEKKRTKLNFKITKSRFLKGGTVKKRGRVREKEREGEEEK